MTAFTRTAVLAFLTAAIALACSAPAHASWAQPQSITPIRSAVATKFDPRTGMTTISFRVTRLAAGVAEVRCADPNGTCPIKVLTERNPKSSPLVTWNLVRIFGAAHQLGPGARVQLTLYSGEGLARTVVVRTRAKAAPLVDHGCLETIPGSLRTCSSAIKHPLTPTDAGTIRTTVQASATTELGKLRSIRSVDAGPSRYALAVYAPIAGETTPRTALLTSQLSDTGDAPTPWKVEWITRSTKPRALCRLDEQPRELWFPALADSKTCP